MNVPAGLLLLWLATNPTQPAAEAAGELELAPRPAAASSMPPGAVGADADEARPEPPERFTPPWAPRDAAEREWRQALEEILARREFRANPRASGLDPRLPQASFLGWIGDQLRQAWEIFVEWVRSWRRRSGGDARRPLSDAVSQPVTWALVAAVAALFGLLLYRAWRRRAAPPAASVEVGAVGEGQALPDALSRPADAWARFADEFARTGEWRLALRALYLRLLALLHERGAIRYERQRTNGDYVAALGGGPAAEPFRRVTASFDSAWYGNKAFERDDYEAVLTAVRAVDRATARAVDGGAGA